MEWRTDGDSAWVDESSRACSALRRRRLWGPTETSGPSSCNAVIDRLWLARVTPFGGTHRFVICATSERR